MRFDSEKASKQILEKGIVATIRTYPYKEGKWISVKIKERTLFGYKVTKTIENPTPEDLKSYADISGFENFGDWWAEYLRLKSHPYPQKHYLVVVKKER